LDTRGKTCVKVDLKEEVGFSKGTSATKEKTLAIKSSPSSEKHVNCGCGLAAASFVGTVMIVEVVVVVVVADRRFLFDFSNRLQLQQMDVMNVFSG
jgi:hypothetical protein